MGSLSLREPLSQEAQRELDAQVEGVSLFLQAWMDTSESVAKDAKDPVAALQGVKLPEDDTLKGESPMPIRLALVY